MSELLSLFTPIRRRNLLQVFIAALVILIVLTIIGTPAPRTDTTLGGATVDLRADRAWVFVPGQCVTVSWNLEGIKSLYIDGGGKIGWGEESFCPSLKATSPVFEITAANGEIRDFRLSIHYLPADVIHSLALMALLAPFVAAIYFLAIPRLEQPIPLNFNLLLAFVALYLLCLFLQSFRVLTLDSILDGLADIFVSPAWQVFGLVLAGLVFIPLAIQETWKGVNRRAWADFIVVITLFAVVLMLYLPFGLDSIGHWEEWVFRAFLEGRPSKASVEVGSRFWLLVPHVLANFISYGSFSGYHILNILMFWSKLLLFYVILRQLTANPFCAFLCTILFMVYPVTAGLMSLRFFLMQFRIMSLFAMVCLALAYHRNPSRLRLVGIWMAALLNVSSYESAYAIIAVIPILWWRNSPRWTWRNKNMTLIWILFPAAKVTYVLLLNAFGRDYYGSRYVQSVSSSTSFDFQFVS